MDHTGTTPFETERLICRRFERSDCEDILTYWAADPDIQLEYGEPVYTDISQVKGLLDKYIRGYESPEYYRWAIIEKESGKNIGQIAFCRVWTDCMTAEIEYCIGKARWGRGYAGEVLAGLTDHIFRTTDFYKLEAYHRAENKKSGRVLEKSRMYITDNVERFRKEGITPVGEVCYCIERNEYFAEVCRN